MKRIALAGLLLLSTTALSGCADLHLGSVVRDAVRGGPHVNDNVFLLRNNGELDGKNPIFDHATDVGAVVPNACKPKSGDGPGPTDADVKALDADPVSRSTCVRMMLVMLKLRSYDFQHNVLASLSTGNFILDTTALGLTISGPLVAAGTAKVLSAIAAGVIGSRKNFDQDFLYSYSISTILKQMDTDQLGVETRILAHLGKDGGYASMSEAVLDLYDYQLAGSWDHAMKSLETNVAATTAACQARSNEVKAAQAGTDPKNLPADFPTSTLFNPCPLPKDAAGAGGGGAGGAGAGGTGAGGAAAAVTSFTIPFAKSDHTTIPADTVTKVVQVYRDAGAAADGVTVQGTADGADNAGNRKIAGERGTALQAALDAAFKAAGLDKVTITVLDGAVTGKRSAIIIVKKKA